jgi:UDP-glucose 4-epimerase
VKVFVTGGAGYVGSICVEQLLDRGHEVVVFDNLSEGHRESIDPRATFIQGDLNDPMASAHILALSAEKSDSFNLGSGGGTSVKEVLKTCRKVSGRSIPAIEKVRRPGDPPRLVASSEKAKQELNWNPQFAGIEAIVESAWQWHAAHPNGYSD